MSEVKENIASVTCGGDQPPTQVSSQDSELPAPTSPVMQSNESGQIVEGGGSQAGQQTTANTNVNSLVKDNTQSVATSPISSPNSEDGATLTSESLIDWSGVSLPSFSNTDLNVSANQATEADSHQSDDDVDKSLVLEEKDAAQGADCEAVALSPERAGTAVTATSPLMEKVKQKAADMKSNTADDVAKDIYHLKWISFKSRKVPIVTQNINGPCPLLAIINVLLLKGKITLDESAEVVTSSQLMGYLGDIVLQIMPENLEEGEQANWEQNVNDAIVVFHKLQTGLDVNVRFTGVEDFEYTPECVVFDLLNITLYHGWLVDTALPDTVQAVGNLTYNQLVEKVIENQASEDQEKATQALLGQMFLNESASQLTYHGLSELSSALADDQLAVFFRNNHFSTIYKHRGELFVLVTDQGYLREGQVVWETLANVEGDGHLVDAEFHTVQKSEQDLPQAPEVAVNTQEQVDQDLMLALSLNQQLQQEPVPVKASSSETDEQFAQRLQEEENRQAALQHDPSMNSPNRSPRRQQQQSRQRRESSESAGQDTGPRERTRKKSGSCVLL